MAWQILCLGRLFLLFLIFCSTGQVESKGRETTEEEAPATVLEKRQQGFKLESWHVGFPLSGTHPPSLCYTTQPLNLCLNVTSLGKSSIAQIRAVSPVECFMAFFPLHYTRYYNLNEMIPCVVVRQRSVFFKTVSSMRPGWDSAAYCNISRAQCSSWHMVGVLPACGMNKQEWTSFGQGIRQDSSTEVQNCLNMATDCLCKGGEKAKTMPWVRTHRFFCGYIQ